MSTQPGIHLRTVSAVRKPAQPDRFPFNVPVIRTFETLEFVQPVTFFIGENGSGKSTFLKAQFLIATHSPILMAFPGASILNFEDGKIQPVRYEEVEHVRITKSFLENPERYLRNLFEE